MTINTKMTTLLVALLLLLTACNLNQPEPEVIFITATPDVPETTPLPPTLTPTEPPPPTPTIAPDLLMRAADNRLLNGYFEEAVGGYRALLEQGAPSEMQAAARFGLGQAALREGMFGEAVAALTELIDNFPDDSRVARAHFMRGDAYLGLSEWALAIADFQRYLALRPGWIDSYVHERIGDAQLALSQTAEALISYGAAIDASRTLIPQVALREKAARIHRSVGQYAEAVAQYDAILAAARNPGYRAGIELAAAETLLAADETEAALARFLGVFETHATTPQAYEAMQRLQAAEQALDDYAVGRVSFFYGDYEGAIEALNRYTTQRILAAIPAELHLLLGRAYRELGSTDAAVVAFQTIIDQYPQDALFGEALLEQGATRFLAGDDAGAIERYLFIADNYGYLPEAPEALWRAGYIYATTDQPEQARVLFERLASEHPNTSQAVDGLFLAASAAFALGQFDRAEQYYARVAATASGDQQASAYLQVGQLALRRGDQSIAGQALQRAVGAAPDGYFSARAQDLIAGRAPFAQPTAFIFQFDEAAELAGAEDWIRQTYGVEEAGALWPLSETLQRDPRMIRGTELWSLGAFESAGVEFGSLIDEYQGDGLASYRLATYLRGIGAYRLSILAASYVLRAANIGTLDAPPYLARMRYPIYYLDVVLSVAERREIDPLVLFSLIRAESLFDTNATAAAGEKGLMQVIPPTAEYIAAQIQWPDYQHADLFRPFAGIEFGAYYLDEQLRRFNGNVAAALAGYNAGPGRAASWLEISGGDPDSFMTAITIESTRGYVQRIYSFYTIYQALYSKG